MATRPTGYGMTAELNLKKAAKFDPELANEALEWIRDCLERGNDEQSASADNIKTVSAQKEVVEILKDGIILCHLVNVIKPNSAPKISKLKQPFKMMENIGKFLSACESFGCKKGDLFQTTDLYDGTNVPQTINGIFALGRKVSKINPDVPSLGPDEATSNRREFSDEQLRAGEGIIGLQAGSNKGASQAGQNFGKTRAIID